MRPVEIIDTVVDMFHVRRPLMIWGPPGVGKSTLVRQAAKKLDVQMIDIRAVLLDPVDLRGVPRVNEREVDTGSMTITRPQTQWCPPEFLPNSGEGIIFLDELPQAIPAVQSALLQLVLDRKIGEYSLPDGWYILAAGNRTTDKAGTHRMISPLKNRFVHIEAQVHNEDWNDWAFKGGIHHMVRSFIQFCPGLLMQFDSESKSNSFASPRSWEFVSDIIKRVAPSGRRQEMIAGAVGDGPAAQFCGYVDNHQKLPDIDALLSKPTKDLIPTDNALRYALVGALSDRAQNGLGKAAKASKAIQEKLANSLFEIADMMPREFAIMLIRDVLTADPNLCLHKKAKSWISTHKALLSYR